MDSTLLALVGTCAFQFYPHFWTGSECVTHAVDPGSPFGHGVFVCSLGFIAVLVLSIPLGYFNLDDNIIVQKIACLLLLAIVTIWCAFFAERGLSHGSLLPFGNNDYTSVVGYGACSSALSQFSRMWLQ